MPPTLRRLLCFAFAACVPASAAADPAGEKKQILVKLRTAIANNITTPCGIKPTQRAEVKLLLQDNGYLQGIMLIQSSGAPAFDAALMTAITDAQPFALPQDGNTRKDLLNLNLNFDAFSTPIPPCKGKKQ
jgi:TonB family protein